MAEKKYLRRAKRYQRALEKGTKAGVRQSAKLSIELQKDIIKRYKKGTRSFTALIENYSMLFSVQVELGAVFAHVLGMLLFQREAFKEYEDELNQLQLDEEEEEAIRELRALLVSSGFTILSDRFSRSVEIDNITIKNYAADVTGMMDEVNLSQLERQQIVARYQGNALQAGAEFTKRLDARVNDAMQDIVLNEMSQTQGVRRINKAFQLAGTTARHDYWYETIYRTNMQVAMAAGRQQSASQPIVSELLWGYAYVTMHDDRVRPKHAAVDGVKLPKEDLWWQDNFPPNGWNCRCTAVEVFQEEAVKAPTEEMVSDSPAFEQNWEQPTVITGL